MLTKLHKRYFCSFILLLICSDAVLAQNLEPRRWANLPMGLNIVGTGLVWTDGDIFLDPVLRIEDATFEVVTVGSSYVRTFELFGKSSRIDFRLPYSHGRWEGFVDSQYVSTRRQGFGDPRIRFSTILYGPPPLKGREYMDYFHNTPVDTSVGFGVSVSLPLGEYYADRLINLGNNRFVIRPQLGVLHRRQNWQFELTGTAVLFQDNDEFFGNSTWEQEPLWFIEGHVIRNFSRGKWCGLSGGYSAGSHASLNGVALDNKDRTKYLAVSCGMPVSAHQNIKAAWISADTNVLVGSSSDSLSFSWSVSWGR